MEGANEQQAVRRQLELSHLSIEAAPQNLGKAGETAEAPCCSPMEASVPKVSSVPGHWVLPPVSLPLSFLRLEDAIDFGDFPPHFI